MCCVFRSRSLEWASKGKASKTIDFILFLNVIFHMIPGGTSTLFRFILSNHLLQNLLKYHEILFKHIEYGVTINPYNKNCESNYDFVNKNEI